MAPAGYFRRRPNGGVPPIPADVSVEPYPLRPMKKSYAAPALQAHGTVEQLTAIFGSPVQQDVLRAGGTVVATGTGSINACAEVGGTCI